MSAPGRTPSVDPPAARRRRGAPRLVSGRRIGRLLAALVGALLVAPTGSMWGPVVPVAAADAGTSAPARPADAAAAWLAGQTTGGTITYLGAPDDGLAADAALSLTALGSADAAAAALTAQLAVSSRRYTSPAGEGQVLSGPTAKLVLLAHARGLDPTSFGGRDLLAALRSTLVVDPGGRDDGRFADRPPTGATTPADASNGFSQAYALLALRRSGTEVPAAAIDYLLAQQCPNGGFRLFAFSGRTCVTDRAADTDTTALAIMALTALPGTGRDAIDRATAHLVALQDVDGSFANSGPAGSANTNTAGLAAAALRATGRLGEAARATDWIVRQQLGCGDVPDGSDVGAIAYSPRARQAALGAGVTATARDQFRRATAQALLAFATQPIGGIAAPTASAQPPVCDTTVPSTTSTTIPTTGPTTGPTTPPTDGSTGGGGDAPAEVLGISRTAPVADGTPVVAELAFTGGPRGGIAAIGLVALLLGLACLGLEHRHTAAPDRRRRRHP